MSVQINKEGRSRYKRQFCLPGANPNYIRTNVYLSKGGKYWGKFEVAETSFGTKGIVIRCPHCGLQMYGQWYVDEKLTFKSQWINQVEYSSSCYLSDYDITCAQLWKAEAQEKEAYAEVSKKIEFEMANVRAMQNCPLCGRVLSEEDKDYWYSWNSGDWHKDRFYHLVEKQSCIPDVDVDKVILSIKNTIIPQTVYADIEKIAGNPGLLQQYLKHILNTETTVRLLEERLRSLYASSRKYQKAYIRQQAEEMASIAQAHYYSNAKIKEPEMNDVVLDESMPIEPRFTQKPPIEPIYEKPGLFNKKKIQAQNELRRSNYEANCQAYQQKLAEHQKALDEYKIHAEAYTRKKAQVFLKLLNEYNAKTKAERTAFVAQIDNKKTEILNRLGAYVLYNETIEEIKRTEELLSQSYTCLKRLYGCGVIYEKYHDPVALASFYDYFASGRCTSLTGADGAYNLFESEVRMDRIVTKLDVVVEKLDRIEKNQYALYSVMSEMNSNLDTLNRTASAMADSLENIKDYQKNISDNTTVIAHNTAVTAFYTKKNAELTDALGFMVALK